MYQFDEANKVMMAKCCKYVAMKFANITRFYTPYQAARDLNATINAVAVGTTKISIFAISYGTYLTNQLLQVPGFNADVVVLDGPIAPNRWPLLNQDAWTSRTADALLGMCAQNSDLCNRYLGSGNATSE
jgi:pimeloyl-ACP methyl ester carboxylesterase